MEESALVWRRAPWCGGERPGVEEAALVLIGLPACAETCSTRLIISELSHLESSGGT